MCIDIAGQLESVFTVYFVGTNNKVYRVPSKSPYTVTLLYTCATTDALLGASVRGPRPGCTMFTPL